MREMRKPDFDKGLLERGAIAGKKALGSVATKAEAFYKDPNRGKSLGGLKGLVSNPKTPPASSKVSAKAKKSFGSSGIDGKSKLGGLFG